MLDTLIGTLFGGAFRILPEVMKLWERSDERKHELAMFDKQIEADKLRGQLALEQADAQIGITEIQAMIEATKAQAVQTGIKWVDGLNSLIRPFLAIWWCVVLYSVSLYCQYAYLVQAGTNRIEAVLEVWGPDEKAIVASIFSFFFLDRTIRKK